MSEGLSNTLKHQKLSSRHKEASTMSKYCILPIYHWHINLDYGLSKYKLLNINYSIINIQYKLTEVLEEKATVCHHLLHCQQMLTRCLNPVWVWFMSDISLTFLLVLKTDLSKYSPELLQLWFCTAGRSNHNSNPVRALKINSYNVLLCWGSEDSSAQQISRYQQLRHSGLVMRSSCLFHP